MATVLEIMPPYPEKQSPLLVRLKQKKPLMESEGVLEPPPPSSSSSHTTTHAVHHDDVPKLAETAVIKRNLFI